MPLILIILLCVPYFVNAYQVTQCDFEPDYKCEVIHGAAVFIGPLAYLTVWFDVDKE